MVKCINSFNNPLIKKIKQLHVLKWRDIYRQFLIEGDHVINEALVQNKVQLLMINEKYINTLNINHHNIIVVTEKIITDLLLFKNSKNKTMALCDYELQPETFADRLVMLDCIQNPNNLGAIIRSCIAFNINTIYLSNDSIDIHHPKVIYNSQGYFFHINLIKCDLNIKLNELKNKNYLIVGTDFNSTTIDVETITLPNKVCFLFGNEGSGINTTLLPLINTSVKINTNPKVESLNLSIATSIILYTTWKKINHANS